MRPKLRPQLRHIALAGALAGASLFALGYPALSQGNPESLLPEGFGEPVQPSAAPTASNAPASASGAARPKTGGVADIKLPASDEAAKAALAASGNVTGDLAADAALIDATTTAEKPATYEMPPAALRRVDKIGRLTPAHGGLGENAFGGLKPRYVMSLMHDMDAPIASRWASILLRRTLLSQVRTPRGVTPADWVAERANLLLRMGEADAARALVQSVDVHRFTPRLLDVGANAALATADPMALCPLVQPALAISKDPQWSLAEAMCAALSGEAAQASALIDRARMRQGDQSIDVLLAEKVVGAGVNGRRAVKIEWSGVDKLTNWRFGLANAVAVEIPPKLIAGMGPYALAWQARAPMVPFAARLDVARQAAVMGVFSSQSLVDIYGGSAIGVDPVEFVDSPADLLRRAYAGPLEDRLQALRKLWEEPEDEPGRYAALLLTARAAAYLPPHVAFQSDINRIIPALLSAGFDRQAAKWEPIIARMDDQATEQAWAALSLALPRSGGTAEFGRVKDYLSNDDSDNGHRGRLLVAGMAGLGRLSPGDARKAADEAGLDIVIHTAWAKAIMLAAERGQPGTVALLAATGMQAKSWADIPASHLFHICRAMKLVGLEPYARLIAVEAITRA
jgi:hypothetical protein